MLLNAVRRFLRDSSPVRVSRSLKDTAYRAMQAREKLTGVLGREPDVLEIARELQLPKEEVVLALDAIVEPVSLYEPVFSDGGDTLYVMDQVSDGGSDESWIQEMSIRDAMEKLTEREKRIIYLRFFRGKTQMEVSGEIGISQAQVSRLEKGALAKVKSDL